MVNSESDLLGNLVKNSIKEKINEKIEQGKLSQLKSDKQVYKSEQNLKKVVEDYNIRFKDTYSEDTLEEMGILSQITLKKLNKKIPL